MGEVRGGLFFFRGGVFSFRGGLFLSAVAFFSSAMAFFTALAFSEGYPTVTRRLLGGFTPFHFV